MLISYEVNNGRRQYSPHREVMTIDDYDDSHPILIIPQVTHLKVPKENLLSTKQSRRSQLAAYEIRDNDKPISMSRHPVGLKTEETIGALSNSGYP